MLIARKKETELLKQAMNDDKSHFIAVYGRRRIGKTFLVRESYDNRFSFSHAGIAEGSLKEQLRAFKFSLQDAGYTVKKDPKDWIEAFSYLKELIKNSSEKKKLIFLDELSWMDTPRSNMLSALENFWNAWACGRKDVVLIVCASATSWIISNIVHNKGGLYNRLTEQIHLQPFSLSECEEMVKANGLVMTRPQILQSYMILGGIPYYWELLQKGKSPAQNIDSLFFAQDAPLKEEYKYLYASMYKNPGAHKTIIETLATKKIGMTRDEIIKASGIINSGDLTKKLDELESCGFIRKYCPISAKKKNAVYQLIDCFTLYYHKFMHDNPKDEHYWTNIINTAKVNIWMGLAFERVCLLHSGQIKKALGIAGVQTELYSWQCKADIDAGIFGSQIDMLMVRADNVINLCEMKYSSNEYTVDKDFVDSIEKKKNDLIKSVASKYAIHTTLLTPVGIINNAYSGEVQSVVTLDDLFEK